ncbi:toxin VasX [Halopseudomonas phragmitis]|uniref:Toxin VasX N-terminal region domain-containing protein n=1 Tax=Halopseudomonas phragmitis TaxID=1931241 RepID=A0A1V0B399_9GAMM|nr:toxin VasX [Halopseudomonas phragmitis]AQZ94254.1 hypothetical protein BVH74_05570 [Halopseudomonas phragmitis]
MTTDNQQQVISLDQADQSAQQGFDQESLDSPVAGCPARDDEICIVPARYALAEFQAEDPCIAPVCTPQSHPMALRQLRPGYLYLWQSDEGLRRFAVANDGLLQEQDLASTATLPAQGALAGLVLPKVAEVWLAYTEIPLPVETCQLLAESQALRAERMRRISLPAVARELEIQHCPALERAEQLVAELMPGVQEMLKAHEYRTQGDSHRQDIDALGQRMMENPTPERVQAYVSSVSWLHELEQSAANSPEQGKYPPGYWSSMPWQVAQVQGWIRQANADAGGLYAVLVAVDDTLGMLRDFNHEQGKVSEIEAEWGEANGHKGLMAGFINSLRSEDGAELAGLINYRYRDHEIQLTREQGEQLLEAQHRLKPIIDRETELNRYGQSGTETARGIIQAQQEEILAPIRSFIPADLHGHVRGVVMNYSAAKARNMTGDRAGAQVAERVRLDDMERWTTQVAEPHRAWVASRRQPLFNDTGLVLGLHQQGSWFVDYSQASHCDWLSELALNTLSELCTAGPGVMIATDLLRNPTPDRPLSLLASAFTPELADFVAGSKRLTEIEAVLTADNAELAGKLLERLAGLDKLNWLQGLGGPDGNDWGRAVGRLGAAFVELEAAHLKGAAALPLAIQYFPKQLLSLMLVLKVSADMALEALRAGYRLSGPLGQAVWDWASEAARKLRLGLAARLARVEAVNAYGGALSLVALLLHGVNLVILKDQGTWREHDDVRQMEYLSTALNTAAALSAVILNVANTREMLEISVRRARLPLVTMLGFVTGTFAMLAGVADLRQLSAEQKKEHSDWGADEWGRLLRFSGQTALATTYGALGGYATYMFLSGRWDSFRATTWFTRGIGFVGWGVLLVEVLYFVWRRHTHRTDMQRFLEQCCWGTQRRWTDSPDDQRQEFQALIDMLFMPQLGVQTMVTSRQIGNSGNRHTLGSRIDSLTLLLPGAVPDTTRLGIKLAAVTPGGVPEDITDSWVNSVTCEWLPIQQGMGLKLSGSLADLAESQHLEVRVLYHSPLAMLTGTLDERNPVVGGRMGMRYLVRGGRIIEHASTDGPLPSDQLPIRQALSFDANLQLRTES